MLQVDESVLKDIGRGFSVPAQPSLLLELQEKVKQGEPNLDEIAELIAQDISVSAKVLKTINSPLYGLSRKIADIPKSVKYIGLNGIVSLVTSDLIRKSFNQQGCSISLESFWDNASNIANTAVFIGQKLRRRIAKEKLFTLGLFHDCGIPVMAIKYNNYQQVLDFAEKNPSEVITKIEEKAYQVSHATIGYYVATSWRLPTDICQLILRHHERDFLAKLDGSETQLAFAILKMAENIVHQHKYFRPSSDWQYLQDSIFTVLDCDEYDYQDLLEDLDEVLTSTR
ncbi:HDOD domain-containing protein [Thalassotalea euphylliae]|uniref:HDOD domain-containing protein n=1 Tax=Thalassotalea euphylliae TaxID=1655234 RepID=A0A3E0U568_9GAMM|nr:HDOD domain-containing protein [Thalassotalea euphylliae]REL31880.1 HDOD domain-containing protein [Thalassotalea euphylliae]